MAVSEFGARIILKPVDYLSVTTAKDSILGHKILPNHSGHDSWGFRNPHVPESAEIVTIGDSHTHGHSAKMKESWPYVLQSITSKNVYNLGMGGYGPNQYFYLLKNKALKLKPKMVICGLYIGDDLDNAYTISYYLDSWSNLRDKSIKNTNIRIYKMDIGSSWHKKIRHWFSCHSVLYQVIVHGPALGWLKGRIQVKNAQKIKGQTAVLILKEKNISEAFIPNSMLQALDLGSVSTQEGLRITLKLLHEMNSLCKRNSIRFVVVLITNKETVFSKYIEHNNSMHLSDVIDRVITNTHNIRQILFDFFRQNDIEMVDPLSKMQSTIEKEKLYTSSSGDMHPNKNGYRIIGECVAQYLDSTYTNR